MPSTRSSISAIAEGQAKALLAAIVDSSDDAILAMTLEGRVTTWNRGAQAIYGYAPDEAIGREISFIVPEGRREELHRVMERIRGGERVEHLETVRLHREGRTVDVSLTLAPVLDRDGAILGVSVVGRDITEQVRMEQSLAESEKRYRTLVEMAPDAVVVHQEGRFVYANCAALGIYGAESLEQLRGVSLVDLIHPEEREAVRQRICQLLEGEEIPLREYRLLRINGGEISIEVSSSLIDYQGRPSIQTIARDITERKRAERERESMLQQLVLERNRFDAVVRQMPMAVLVAEVSSGRLIFHNDQCPRVLGQEPALANCDDYLHWKMYRSDGSPLPVGEFPLVRALRGESVVEEELQIDRSDGSRGYVSFTATPVRDLAGKVVSAVAAASDISERKIAARALAESEERLNLALEAAEMGSCDLEVASGAGVWSRRHFLLLGYPPPQGSSGPGTLQMWLERVHPEDREELIRSLEEAKRQGSFFRSEHRIVRADNGETSWMSKMGRFICDEGGALCRFIGVIFEISERKRGDEALRRSEERFRQMADSMPQIVWTSNPDGSVDYFNIQFQLYTGLEPDSLLVKAEMPHPERLIQELTHPDDVDRVIEAWEHAVRCGEPYQKEMRIRRVDGVYRWHLSRALPQCNERGEIVKWYGTATDIHDLRELQERLQASEAKFRWLYESNLIAIFFWNKDGGITEANQAFCELVGYGVDQCKGGELSWLDVTPAEYFAKDYAAIEEIMESGICRPYEKMFVNRQDGSHLPVLLAGARMTGADSDGIAFAVDLTDLKRTEQALKNSEATLKLAIEITGLGIFDCDLVTGKKNWSDIMKRHFGLSPASEVSDATCLAAIHPEDADRVRHNLHQAMDPHRGGVYSAEYRTVGIEDGRVRWLTVRGKVSFDEQGEPLRVVGACLDITEIVKKEKALKEEISERLRAVEELRKQEQLMIRQGRLAAMGEMIGNIAHQWRQPLNTLGLIVQELPVYYDRKLFDREYLIASVTRAMQVINYMSKTIDGFRNFFGPDKEKESFRAEEVIYRTVSIIEAAFNELNLKIEVSADPGVVLNGCPNEFSQVLLNILVNAKDALVERKVADPRVELRLFRENGKGVITISDNAGGISAEIIDKIFDPYFTTKGPDKGTGIGLFMSKTIIEKNMNGSLTVRNTDRGAEFRIEV